MCSCTNSHGCNHFLAHAGRDRTARCDDLAGAPTGRCTGSTTVQAGEQHLLTRPCRCGGSNSSIDDNGGCATGLHTFALYAAGEHIPGLLGRQPAPDADVHEIQVRPVRSRNPCLEWHMHRNVHAHTLAVCAAVTGTSQMLGGPLVQSLTRTASGSAPME